jgi:hypothetical protein
MIPNEIRSCSYTNPRENAQREAGELNEEELSARIEKGMAHITSAFEEFGMAVCEFARAAEIFIGPLVESLNLCADGIEKIEILSVATPRQRYLCDHGSPRVRKKWKNALRRKARISRKRRK